MSDQTCKLRLSFRDIRTHQKCFTYPLSNLTIKRCTGITVSYVVVVQCYPWFEFFSLLFLGMVMYNNKFKTKENKIKPRVKLNHNIYMTEQFVNYISLVSFSVLHTTPDY